MVECILLSLLLFLQQHYYHKYYNCRYLHCYYYHHHCTLTLSKETEALARALSSCSTGTLVRLELRNRNHLNTNTITNISHTAVVIYIKQCSIVHPFPFIMSRTPYSLVLLPLIILYYSYYCPYYSCY